jgi:signal transduction histidine kinase
VLDSLAEAVLVADANRRILLFNQSANELLGIDLRATPPEQWITELSLRKADGTPFEVPELPLSRALRGERVDDLEMLVRAGPDNVERQLSATARPLMLDGKLWGGVAVLRDVSVQRRHEAQLIISDRMASVGALAAGVAHEINTPMQYISDNVTFLSESVNDLADVISAYRTDRERGDQVAAEVEADYLLAEETTCVALPDQLSYVDGALVACGFGTVYEALNRVGVSGQDRLLNAFAAFAASETIARYREKDESCSAQFCK